MASELPGPDERDLPDELALADIDYILEWICQVDDCTSIRARLPENIRGLAKRAKHWRKARPADERLREGLEKIARGEYDNAHDCKAAARLARAYLEGGGK